MQWHQGEFTLDDSRETLDVDVIHGFLRGSYWARGISRALVVAALDRSLCFGLFHGDRQIGFGRVVSDRATFAYLADVFVVESYRGRGLGRWLVSCVLEHPELQGLRRWMLATRDAHGLYARHGFAPLRRPEWFMEINDPDIYQREA
jgi:GNAT superfamily N-acetyltransferase